MAEDVIVRGGLLEVRFVFAADRWGHRLSIVDGSTAVPLLESIEGAPRDIWPASPSLQEVTLQDRSSERAVATALGACGSSHFAVSLQIVTDRSATAEYTTRVEIDVACRVQSRPPSIGSAYRLMPGVALRQSQLHVGGRCLDLHTAENTNLLVEASTGIRLTPVEIEPGLPATLRWQYAIAITDAVDTVWHDPSRR